MSRTYGKQVWDEIDAFMKRAGSDPDKDTSHPVKNVDGGTQPATEGARSAENTADVKKTVANSVDAAPANLTSGDGPALTNTTAKPTGEDPSNETQSVKSSPTDPGTSHPAKVGGEKYAELITSGDEILAELTVAGQAAKSAAKKDPPAAVAPAAASPEPVAPAAPAPAADPSKKTTDVPGTSAKSAEAATPPPADPPAPDAAAIKAAEEAGAAAAREAIKQAEAAQVEAEGRALIEDIVKTAELDAENVVQFLHSFQANKQAALKAAEGEEQLPVGPGGPMDAGGGLPPEAMAAAAGGGEMPPGAGGAGEGGGGQELIQALVQAIQAGLISPEEIVEALQSAEGGAGGAGGMPPEAAGGGVPPEAAAAAGGMPPEAAKAATLKRIKALKPAEKSAALVALARQGARAIRR